MAATRAFAHRVADRRPWQPPARGGAAMGRWCHRQRRARAGRRSRCDAGAASLPSRRARRTRRPAAARRSAAGGAARRSVPAGAAGRRRSAVAAAGARCRAPSPPPRPGSRHSVGTFQRSHRLRTSFLLRIRGRCGAAARRPASCPCRGRGPGRRSAPGEVRIQPRRHVQHHHQVHAGVDFRVVFGARRHAPQPVDLGSSRASAPHSRSSSNMRLGRLPSGRAPALPDALGHQRIHLAGLDHGARINAIVSAPRRIAKRAAKRASRRMRTGSSAKAGETWRSKACRSRCPPCGSTSAPSASRAIALIVRSRREVVSSVTSARRGTTKPAGSLARSCARARQRVFLVRLRRQEDGKSRPHRLVATFDHLGSAWRPPPPSRGRPRGVRAARRAPRRRPGRPSCAARQRFVPVRFLEGQEVPARRARPDPRGHAGQTPARAPCRPRWPPAAAARRRARRITTGAK